MRLTQLHIENFRALETMDIALHPMTVIVGENDVGKTSCMLAVQTLFERKKLENKSDYFKADTSRTVVIDACLDCPFPSESQAEFVCDGIIRVKCCYPFNKPREILVRKPIPKNEAFQNISKQVVDDLRKTLAEIGQIEKDAKPSKPESQKLLSKYISGLPSDQFLEDWCSVSETEFGKLLPDFVLVSVGRSLDEALKLTDSSLLGRLFRPLLKDTMKVITDEDALAEVRRRLKDSVRQHQVLPGATGVVVFGLEARGEAINQEPHV